MNIYKVIPRKSTEIGADNMARKHTSIWIKEDLAKQIHILAKFMDLSKSQTVEYLIEQAFILVAYKKLLMNLKLDLKGKWIAHHKQLPAFKIFNVDLILERDNKTCQKCGTRENLEVYHINRNPTDFAVDNLITLCKSCIEKVKVFVANEYYEECFVAWLLLTA